ncbi:MAG TPA: hypothetical protein EYP60_01355 [bacterium (Candidatus Stahlbacteria)]|nr:hypothetical protein [Candidatus Stahlbacteria bacterium]
MRKIILYFIVSLLFSIYLSCSKKEKKPSELHPSVKKEVAETTKIPKLPKDFKSIHQFELEKHKGDSIDSTKK